MPIDPRPDERPDQPPDLNPPGREMENRPGSPEDDPHRPIPEGQPGQAAAPGGEPVAPPGQSGGGPETAPPGTAEGGYTGGPPAAHTQPPK